MSKIGRGGTQSPGPLPVSESALPWSRDPVLATLLLTCVRELSVPLTLLEQPLMLTALAAVQHGRGQLPVTYTLS